VTTGLVVTPTISNTTAPLTRTANYTIKYAGSFSVAKGNPIITWPDPAAINYGTALSSTQLNAKANIPGNFVYTPASGAILGVGTQTLYVTFTPADTTDYGTATSTVSLKVNTATPNGLFPNQIRYPVDGVSYIIVAGDLNATFSNPYSGAAVAPTGTVTYSLVATGAVVIPGTQLANGSNYDICALYLGDSNYTPTSVTATFTIVGANVDVNNNGVPDWLEAAAGLDPSKSNGSGSQNYRQMNYDDDNRLKSGPGRSYQYDDEGNILSQ
jgi:hypothetical protein